MKKIGIDLGGHTIAAGSVDFFGAAPQVLSAVTVPTPENRDLLSVIHALEELILLWAAPGDECFVGIGIPGFVDSERRRILRLTNFVGCDGVLLGKIISANLKARGVRVDVRLENDANCAALGEGAAGAARGLRDYVVLTLGTGIGAGIVANDGLLTGAHGMAAECGHMAVSGDPLLCRCGCGGRGHLEELASADWIERRAGAAGLPPVFREVWEMRHTNMEAAALLEPALEALARGISSLAVTLDPEAVILSGGMSHAAGLADELRGRIEKYLPVPFRAVFILKNSEIGGRSAVIGAASLGQEMCKR